MFTGPLYRPDDHLREKPLADPKGRYRSPFRRDYARLLHCPAFRRLQGKTQLFPGTESDFFRNRLTHSLEVAQIAKSIALRLNSQYDYFKAHPIDLDLVETAALAHDLGHPPFGHNGERALDECMRCKGGFEGNAQSLRIVARLEKKELGLGEVHDRRELGDHRVGLNLTYRTLAAVLKYDRCIPACRPLGSALVKGYYGSERTLVDRIKANVVASGAGRLDGSFRTVECDIMDIADDIAYSTYDLEDALKGGFVSPMSMLSALNSEPMVDAVKAKTGLDRDRVRFHAVDLWLRRLGRSVDIGRPRSDTALEVSLDTYRTSENLSKDGAFRTALTSELVNEYVEGVEVQLDEAVPPPLYRVALRPDLRERVEVIKNLTYELVVNDASLQTVEYRGGRIVKAIFKAIVEPEDGDLLLPDDYRDRVRDRPDGRERTICDFIASMTDRYALEFFGRLHSERSQTIFKPL